MEGSGKMNNDRYILMNKNRPLVEVEVSESGFIIATYKIYDESALPVGVYVPNTSLVNKLNEWWHRRIIPASRDGLKFILHLYDIESASILSKRSLGLSLSDQYWIKPVDSDLTWDAVNFFTNEFSAELGEAFFNRGSSKPSINPFTPDASSNGWLKKKWVKINGETYLAKAGSVPLLQQPYNEVVAAKIMEALGIEHVDYKITMEDNRPLCLCKNFITTDTEFVTAHFVRAVLPKSKNDSELGHLLKCAEYLEIPNVKEFINNMLAVDFLIENTDRHYGNFGFIRDVNTLKFIGTAPLFDNGTSLWCEALNSEIGEPQKAMPFKSTHKEQIKLLSGYNFNAENLSVCEDIVRDVLSQSPYIDDVRVERISNAIGNKARVLKNILAII